MKLHSPSRTYNQGDRCRVSHIVDGVTQTYTMEAVQRIKSEFAIAYFYNKSPRVWRLSSLDIDGFVYPGDTIFVGNTGYKNTTQGVKPIREFQNLPKASFGSSNFVAIYEDTLYELTVDSGGTSDFYLRDMFPTWSPWMNTYVFQVQYIPVGVSLTVKCTTINGVNNEVREATAYYNSIYISSTSYSFGTTSTPDLSGSGYIRYYLSDTLNDFQYFKITNNAGVLDVVKYALNTNP